MSVSRRVGSVPGFNSVMQFYMKLLFQLRELFVKDSILLKVILIFNLQFILY